MVILCSRNLSFFGWSKPEKNCSRRRCTRFTFIPEYRRWHHPDGFGKILFSVDAKKRAILGGKTKNNKIHCVLPIGLISCSGLKKVFGGPSTGPGDCLWRCFRKVKLVIFGLGFTTARGRPRTLQRTA
uniref:(northern house mosquito) hypothetical protein n=1 Tax=Culex pipiens TaxID=7175 RepID=A0A8D8MMP8_CULPI